MDTKRNFTLCCFVRCSERYFYSILSREFVFGNKSVNNKRQKSPEKEPNTLNSKEIGNHITEIDNLPVSAAADE